MKIQRTICIDVENWRILKERTDNCSNVINELVTAYLNTTKQTDNTKILQEEIIKLQAEIAKRNEIIKEKEKEVERARPRRTWGETIF